MLKSILSSGGRVSNAEPTLRRGTTIGNGCYPICGVKRQPPRDGLASDLVGGVNAYQGNDRLVEDDQPHWDDTAQTPTGGSMDY
eukprot:16354_6